MRVEEAGEDRFLLARLSMPAWPFSGGSEGGWDGSIEDAGGYWGVGRVAAAAGDGEGGAYDLWSFPPAERAWQGVVGGGKGCTSRRRRRRGANYSVALKTLFSLQELCHIYYWY